MAEHLPLSLQTTYCDLLDRQARRPSPEMEGSITLVENKGGRYWVARRRIGSRVVETRIGPDNADNSRKTEILRKENEVLKKWGRKTSPLHFVLQPPISRRLQHEMQKPPPSR